MTADPVRTWVTPPVLPADALSAGAQPALVATGNVVLRPWRAADAAAFLSAYDDPALMRWHIRRPASQEEVGRWFAQYAEDWAADRGAHWAVTHDGGEVLGRIALRELNFDDGIGVVAYWTLPAARGRGVAPAALATLSTWALDEVGFHRLELDHSTRNAASCRVAVKAGYALEGTKRSAALHEDGHHDMHLHARVRGD
ncbi:GNAT family N-acetyltransferase [Streptomyces sp. NPDC050418]|uniref:GNAT family N-acetyltransferase n=1 Tax=Streptomyces sp. NPDC050418 TaxID=3365612 RepID=UPI0037ACB6BD